MLAAAGITGQIARAAFGTGYASDANFKTRTETKLHAAIGRGAGGAGRTGRDTASMAQSRQDMAARLGTDEGRAVYARRAATIEPVFAHLTARLGRT